MHRSKVLKYYINIAPGTCI